ncbi:Flagellar motor switch protein FliM [hydrothermal vent metagenome]|uniref:Flagellar motor switch protein FliM n=1 Tax=hydrothermal vent metagenome TaxID=652676 RepID=A0A3B0R857_9ZZZZ
MAEQLLSQNEVDALLKGVSGGDIKVAAKEEAPVTEDGIQNYDFTSYSRIIRGRMPAFEMVIDRFCRQARGTITDMLDKVVDITAEKAQLVRFGDFLKNLPLPSSMNIFHLDPLRGSGMLAINSNLVFQIVANYFGGDTRFEFRVEGKEFTSLEQMVIKKFVNIVFDDLNKVWKPVHEVNFTITGTETNPQFVNIMSTSEVVVLVQFNIEVEGKTNNFFLCIPYFTLEPIKEKLYGGYREDMKEIDTKWKDMLKEQAKELSIVASVNIGETDITLGEVLNLSEGDVIQLDCSVKEPLIMKIENIPKLNCIAGKAGRNYAVQITGKID